MPSQLKKKLLSPSAKKAYIILAFFLVLFIVCNDVILPWYVNQGGEITVPSVTGRSFEEASRFLDSLGLVARKGDVRLDREHSSGIVIIQNPLGGHKVKKGRRVYLTVSGGEMLVTVPNIKGRTIRDARFALEREDLKLGAIEYQASDQFPPNTIIEQQIGSGSKVKRESYVSVIVSTGKLAQEVIVPDVTGKPLTEAQMIITGAGLQLGNITYLPSSDMLPNTVLKQFPRGGATVASAQPIDLYVVQGGEKKDATEY